MSIQQIPFCNGFWWMLEGQMWQTTKKGSTKQCGIYTPVPVLKTTKSPY